MSILTLSASQLRKAADLQEQISSLESELTSILGGEAQSAPAASPAKPAVVPAQKRGMSAEGKARIIAAQKARWAKFNAAKVKPAAVKAVVKAVVASKPAPKVSHSDKMKAYWAAKKAGKAKPAAKVVAAAKSPFPTQPAKKFTMSAAAKAKISAAAKARWAKIKAKK